MTLPERSYTSGSGYRFGFNGKETDKEYGAGGGTQDYGFRMYNPAIGKFLSVDPLFKSYPWYTPYQFSGNMPIRFIDLDGLEEFDSMLKWAKETGNVVIGFYQDNSEKIDGFLITTSGVFITVGGVVITPACPPCGAIAIPYGLGQTGFGGAKTLNAFLNEGESNALTRANNYGHLVGNLLDEGFDSNYLGVTGYYTGELISISTGIFSGTKGLINAIKNGNTPLAIYNSYKLNTNGAKAIETYSNFALDVFLHSEENIYSASDVLEKYEIYGNILGVQQLKVTFEVADENGDIVTKSFLFDLNESHFDYIQEESQQDENK